MANTFPVPTRKIPQLSRSLHFLARLSLTVFKFSDLSGFPDFERGGGNPDHHGRECASAVETAEAEWQHNWQDDVITAEQHTLTTVPPSLWYNDLMHQHSNQQSANSGNQCPAENPVQNIHWLSAMAPVHQTTYTLVTCTSLQQSASPSPSSLICKSWMR